MPADNIKRAIQRGTGELPGVTYEEVTYEGYGPAGVAIILEAVTDNANRTVSEIRHVFSRNNGNMGQSGSVAWIFQRKGSIVIPKNGQKRALTEDDVMTIVLEAGADDLVTETDAFTVTTSPQAFDGVKKALEDAGIALDKRFPPDDSAEHCQGFRSRGGTVAEAHGSHRGARRRARLRKLRYR